jgi:hypothetical protein
LLYITQAIYIMPPYAIAAMTTSAKFSVGHSSIVMNFSIGLTFGQFYYNARISAPLACFRNSRPFAP